MGGSCTKKTNYNKITPDKQETNDQQFDSSKKKKLISIKEDFKINAMDFIRLNKKSEIFSDYEIDDNIPLGTGAFSEVRTVTHKITGLKRACKIINKQKQKRIALDHLKNEMEIMKKLDHPNIVKIFDVYQDTEHLYIIQELYTGGELFDKICSKGVFNEKVAAGIIKQILQGLRYCHANGVVHRDIKPENILLESQNSQTLKIIDFGGSVDMEKGNQKKLKGTIGTPYYVAPEVLSKQYNEKCDIWSVGIILYILLCGTPPFNGENEEIILEKVEKGVYNFDQEEWKLISQEAKDFIKKMLEKDVDKRIQASKALQEPWIQQFYDTSDLKSVDLQNCLNKLRSFKQEGKLQQAMYTFLVNILISNEEKAHLLQMFQKLDANNDGLLQREELIDGFTELYGKERAHQEAERILKNTKHDYLEYSEWVLATANRKKMLSEENLKKAFIMFDTDGSGEIDLDEIKDAFQGVGAVAQSVWLDLIKEADKDGNGSIDFDEFKEMMEKMVNDEDNLQPQYQKIQLRQSSQGFVKNVSNEEKQAEEDYTNTEVSQKQKKEKKREKGEKRKERQKKKKKKRGKRKKKNRKRKKKIRKTKKAKKTKRIEILTQNNKFRIKIWTKKIKKKKMKIVKKKVIQQVMMKMMKTIMIQIRITQINSKYLTVKIVKICQKNCRMTTQVKGLIVMIALKFYHSIHVLMENKTINKMIKLLQIIKV